MVRTSSTMLPLGSLLPSFDLPLVNTNTQKGNLNFNLSDRMKSSSLEKKPVLIMVLCAHCPFVKNIESELTQLSIDFGNDIQFLAIASNCLETHPEDGPEHLAEQAKKHGWRFPYLLDSDQSFAIALKAACTPDFFLFAPTQNGVQRLRYRGQLDDSRPGNDLPVTGRDLRSALDAILDGSSVSDVQKPSIGCNIKWHPGKEPSWFG